MLLPTLIIAAPSLTMVTLADAKLHLKVDSWDDDTLITTLINAAESFLDNYSGITGRALLYQTWEQKFDAFYARHDLPIGIASSIVSVKYYDINNVQQTVTGSTYQLFTDQLGSYVETAAGMSWPNCYSRTDAVAIQWVAGYGSTAATVPAAIIVAMKMLVAHWYEFRGVILTDKRMEQIPMAVIALIEQFRRKKF